MYPWMFHARRNCRHVDRHGGALFMKSRLLIVACTALMSAALMAVGQAGDPRTNPQAPSPQANPTDPKTEKTPAPPAPATSRAALPQVASTAEDERALMNRYCVPCHNEKAKGATGPAAEASRKLTLDQLDLSNVRQHAEVLE